MLNRLAMNPWVKKLVRLITSIPAEERDAFWRELGGLVRRRRGLSTREDESLLTVAEACRLLRCHRTTLHRAIRDGEFEEGQHFFRRGRRLFFHKERLLAYLDSRFPRAPRQGRRGTSSRA